MEQEGEKKREKSQKARKKSLGRCKLREEEGGRKRKTEGRREEDARGAVRQE